MLWSNPPSWLPVLKHVLPVAEGSSGVDVSYAKLLPSRDLGTGVDHHLLDLLKAATSKLFVHKCSFYCKIYNHCPNQRRHAPKSNWLQYRIVPRPCSNTIKEAKNCLDHVFCEWRIECRCLFLRKVIIFLYILVTSCNYLISFTNRAYHVRPLWRKIMQLTSPWHHDIEAVTMEWYSVAGPCPSAARSLNCRSGWSGWPSRTTPHHQNHHWRKRSSCDSGSGCAKSQTHWEPQMLFPFFFQ